MKNKRIFWPIALGIVLGTAVILSIWGAISWVAVHFISKFW